MADFLTLCTRLATRSGAIGTPPSAVTDQTGRQAKCVDWVAHAWEMVQLLHQDWSFRQAEWSGELIGGTAAYSAATFNIERFGEWKGDRPGDHSLYQPTTLYDPDIGLSDEAPLKQIGYSQWRERYDRGAEVQNKPVHYCIAPDQTIRFGPVPDKTYNVRGEYRKSPQTLAANADVPDMPDQFHDIIVNRGIILMSEHDESPDGLAAAIRGYTEMMTAMQRDLLPDAFTVLGR